MHKEEASSKSENIDSLSNEKDIQNENFRALTHRENNETTPIVKVEKMEKKRFDFHVIVKWIVGLYTAGAIAVLFESWLTFLTKHLYSFLSTSQFFNAELSVFSSAVRVPLTFLLVTMPFILSSLMIVMLMRLTLNKLAVFSERQKEIYIIIFSSLIVLIAVSVYFSGV